MSTKFSSLFPGEWALIVTSSEALQKPRQAFLKNISRPLQMVVGIRFLCGAALHFQGFFYRAHHSVTGTLPNSPLNSTALPNLEKELLSQLLALGGGDSHRAGQIITSDGSGWVTLLDQIAPEATKDFLVPIVESAVVGTWTAFENLAGDLWSAAVNASPKLGRLRGSPSRIEKVRRDEDVAAKSEEKMLPLTLIHDFTRGTFNIGNRVGDLLRQGERVRFATLAQIRHSYSLAFDDKGPLRDQLDDCLRNSAFNSLAAVRNVLVHNGGLADEKYLEDCNRAPLAPQARLGERITLDGEVAERIIAESVAACRQLITIVDMWIQPPS